MNKEPINVQDSFFHSLRQEELLVEIVLLSGGTRLGRLKRFDKFCVVLEVSGHEEMIYKHAIACIRAEAHRPSAPASPGP
ncbi:MAG: RNA chaperone Hfq [Thermoanaerobaculia bacterium]